MWHEERLFINGELRDADGGATFDNINPATEEVIGVSADASQQDFDDAITAARSAFDLGDWSTDVSLRVRCLEQLHDALQNHVKELSALTVAEVGATQMACSSIQVVEPLKIIPFYIDVAQNYEWHADLGISETLGGECQRWVEKEPVGVLAAITPWNVPNQINLAKIIPALAAGCSVVLKPAPDTPWTGLALGKLIAEHTDFPPGVINIVTASDPAAGSILTNDDRVDMISFTGSTETGKKVMEAASGNITKVFLELGGKSALIVLDDVEDFSMVAATAAFGMATVCGQGCALSTRLLLPRTRYEEAVEAIVNMMGAVPPGDPSDAGTMMGPLISARQRDRVERYVQSAIDEGAKVVCGGKRPEDFDRGFFYEPTLITDVDNSMTVAQEEIFGPVLVAIPFDDDDEAIRIANDSIYGLSGAVFSGDDQRAISVAKRVRTGTMSINGGVWYGADVPFGGYKQSGIGREMGVAGFEEHLETKAFSKPT